MQCITIVIQRRHNPQLMENSSSQPLTGTQEKRQFSQNLSSSHRTDSDKNQGELPIGQPNFSPNPPFATSQHGLNLTLVTQLKSPDAYATPNYPEMLPPLQMGSTNESMKDDDNERVTEVSPNGRYAKVNHHFFKKTKKSLINCWAKEHTR